jgi:hypothetical protein
MNWIGLAGFFGKHISQKIALDGIGGLLYTGDICFVAVISSGSFEMAVCKKNWVSYRWLNVVP